MRLGRLTGRRQRRFDIGQYLRQRKRLPSVGSGQCEHGKHHQRGEPHARMKHEIGEDEMKDWSDQVQKLTDSYIKRIDESLAEKDKEIRQV